MGNRDADVAIVGAGPTGLMLAAELRLGGITAVVLDRAAAPRSAAGAIGFSARTAEEFEQRGLLPAFGEWATIPVGHFGGIPIDFRLVDGGHFGTRGVPQPVTERILAEWAAGLGAELRRGVEVVTLSQRGDGVEVGTTAGTVRARYVVGCDGARSTVRRLAGIEFAGTAATAEVWLADLAGVPLRPRFAGVRVAGGWVTVLPMGPDTSRLLLHERAAGVRDTDRPPAFAEFCAAWTRLTGEDVSAGRPLRLGSYTDESRQAADYRRGRVLLAGDAAHVHLPIHGQGMSGGIQDAVNLGWKLAATVRGTAPAGLLNTYPAERQPVGARILANTLAQRYLWWGGDALLPLRDVLAELVEHEAVRRALIGLVTGLDIRYDVGRGEHPLLGRRLPRLDLVRADSSKTSTFDLLHAGRGVLLDLAGDPAGDPAVRSAAAGWTDRVDVTVAAPHEPGTALDGLTALLVRPDGHLAWVAGTGAGDTDDLPTALTRWFGPPA